MTLTPIAEHLALELSLPVFYDFGLSRLGFEYPNFRSRGPSPNPLRHHRGVSRIKIATGSNTKDSQTCTMNKPVYIKNSEFQMNQIN